MFVGKEELLSVNAVDETPRMISCHEKLMIRCFSCEKSKLMKWSRAINKRNRLDKSFSCPQCTAKLSSETRSFKTTDILTQLNAVDTTPRNISYNEQIELKCHNCSNKGFRSSTDALGSLKKYGYSFRCKSCFGLAIEKRSENKDWLDGIKKAAQTVEHKERARANGRKRLLIKNTKNINDYWDFGDINTQMVAGTESVHGRCKTCKSIEYKPLKKFIELVCHRTRGCNKCWAAYTKTEEYSIIMGSRSAEGGSESRIRQGLSLAEFWYSQDEETKTRRTKQLLDALEAWYQANPDKIGTSTREREVMAFVTEELSLGAKKIKIDHKEIDVFVESANIGLEYNGLYWHSELQKENNYHALKTNHFKERGIRIIHIFAHVWANNKPKIKSFIKSALGLNSVKIAARECEISKISKEESNELFNKYHIQGAPSKQEFSVGLKYNGELVSCASFGKHHRGGDKWVLSRFVTKDDYNIMGGLSRISKFASNIINDDIYTWADLALTDGKGYANAGWTEDGILPPDYFYTDGEKVVSKQSRMKSKVRTPDGMTEHEHALLDGWYRVWDCGKIRFVYKNPPINPKAI